MLGMMLTALMNLFNVGFPAELRPNNFDHFPREVGRIIESKIHSPSRCWVERQDAPRNEDIREAGLCIRGAGDKKNIIPPGDYLYPVLAEFTVVGVFRRRPNNNSILRIREYNPAFTVPKIDSIYSFFGVAAYIRQPVLRNNFYDVVSGREDFSDDATPCRQMPCIIDDVFDISRDHIFGKGEITDGNRFNPNPRPLLGPDLIQRTSLNLPLSKSNADRDECKESDGDCRPSSPSGRFGLGAALLIVGALCIGKGVYQAGERLALNLRDLSLVGIGGTAIVQGVLRLLNG
jgi:hypothetical protein